MFHTTVCKTFFLCLLYNIQCKANVINKIDFHAAQFKDHHTDKFYATDAGSSKVIVRRGDSFTFTVNFHYHIENVNTEVRLTFRTKQDEMKINLPSTRRNDWSIQETSIEGSNKIVISIPADAPVGVWKMQITLISDQRVLENYEVPNKIIVLFNAWSRTDAAYFSDTNKLSEYVLSETGHVYFYNWRTWSYRQWIFGQFQANILDSILFVLHSSKLTAVDRGDIVKVTRALTYLMNHMGRQSPGVLVGRWQEPYTGKLFGYPTTHPSAWTGSAPILRKYYENNGTPVGYGQCWVFAGILTTAYRALGIASRPLGNFGSAHDDGDDLTADTYLTRTGNVDHSRSDTLWNFHEWVEAWFRRDDLEVTRGGWQELDATPQAINDGQWQVGPAANTHIYDSRLRSPYETLYVYSEVNADEVVWDHKGKVVRVNRNKVGIAVKTKAFGNDGTEDITYTYKPREGTQDERDSYKRAAQSINKIPPSLRFENIGRSLYSNIFISIKTVNDVLIGQPIRFTVSLKNARSRVRQLTLNVKLSSIYYNGKLKSEIESYSEQITLKAFGKKNIDFTIESSEYLNKLADLRTVFIDAVALLGDEVYNAVERLTVCSPELQIQAPQTVKRNSNFNVDVNFRNPLNETLKECQLIVEANGIEHQVFNITDVAASSMSKTTLNLASNYIDLETVVITLRTEVLKESVGFAHLIVRGFRKNTFKSYRLRQQVFEKGNVIPLTASAGGVNNVTEDMFECCDTESF